MTMRNLIVPLVLVFLAHALPAQRSNTQPKLQPTTAAPSQTTSTSRQISPDQPNPTATATDRNNQNSGNSGKNTKKKITKPRSATVYPAPTVQPLDAGKKTETAASDRNATDKSSANPSQTSGKTTQNTHQTTAGQLQNQKTLATAAPEKPIKVEWLTIEEATERCKIEKKKIFIDVYTSWCGWCKRMDETTFSDPAVAKYLNDNYYAVKLDAEQEQDIVFKDKTYHYKKMGNRGYNEFAIELLNNRLSFPTVVFLNEDLEVIQALATYLDAPKFETIINYFGTDNHKKTPWEAYERTFVRSGGLPNDRK